MTLYPISCRGVVGGQRVWEKLRHLLIDCKNFLVISSLMMCAASLSFACSFSRADLSWIPTMVTPIGHAL
jgi:hypothetical protein